MKYIAFLLFILAGVPLLFGFQALSSRTRNLFVLLLILSSVIGIDINFVSLETYRGYDKGFRIALIDALTYAWALYLVTHYPSKLRWFPDNCWLGLGFLGWMFISTLFAEVKLLGFFAIWKILNVGLLYWCAYNALWVGYPLEVFRNGFALMGLYSVMIAFKQKYIEGIYRIAGPFNHPNNLPPSLCLFVPFLLAWALCDRRLSLGRSMLLTILVLSIVATCVVTFSRAGMLIAVAAFLGGFIASFRAVIPSRRLLVGGLCLLLSVPVAFKALDSIVERFQTAPQASADTRDWLNFSARAMANDRFFGVGPNNYSVAVVANPAYWFGPEPGLAPVVHHLYWLLASELGYPGLFIFLLMLARFVLKPTFAGLGRRDLEGALLLAFPVGMLGMYASGFLEALLFQPVPMHIFSLTSGVAMALAQQVRRRRLTDKPGGVDRSDEGSTQAP